MTTGESTIVIHGVILDVVYSYEGNDKEGYEVILDRVEVHDSTIDILDLFSNSIDGEITEAIVHELSTRIREE